MGVCSSNNGISNTDKLEIKRKSYFAKEKEVLGIVEIAEIKDINNPEKMQQGLAHMQKLEKIGPELEKELKSLQEEFDMQDSSGKLGPHKEQKRELMIKAKSSFELTQNKYKAILTKDTTAFAGLGNLGNMGNIIK